NSSTSPRTSPRMLTQDSFDMDLYFSCHVLFGIFETTATDRDRQAFTERLPSVIFRPEIAVNRYASGHLKVHHLRSHNHPARILVMQIDHREKARWPGLAYTPSAGNLGEVSTEPSGSRAESGPSAVPLSLAACHAMRAFRIPSFRAP